jgi:hypothetical protein
MSLKNIIPDRCPAESSLSAIRLHHQVLRCRLKLSNLLFQPIPKILPELWIERRFTEFPLASPRDEELLVDISAQINLHPVSKNAHFAVQTLALRFWEGRCVERCQSTKSCRVTDYFLTTLVSTIADHCGDDGRTKTIFFNRLSI